MSSFPYPCFSPLCPQTPEELDDSDFETEDFDVRSRTSVQTEDDQLIAGQSARVSCQSILSSGKISAAMKDLSCNRSNPCPFKQNDACVYMYFWVWCPPERPDLVVMNDQWRLIFCFRVSDQFIYWLWSAVLKLLINKHPKFIG